MRQKAGRQLVAATDRGVHRGRAGRRQQAGLLIIDRVNDKTYGSIGGVFVILSWGIGVVIVGRRGG